MSNQVFAFSDERTLDAVINLVSKPLDFLVGSRLITQSDIYYAKITEVISDTEAKALQQIRNADGTNEDYPDGITWDSDLDQTPENVNINLITYEGFKFTLDQLVECAYIPFADEPKWVGFPPSAGGGGGRELIRLSQVSTSGEPNEWGGDIVSKRAENDEIVTPNITIVAPHFDEGVLPLTGTNVFRFWRADAVENTDEISDAFGLPDPPSTVYEIFPSVAAGV